MKQPISFKIIKANKSHFPEIEKLIIEARIGEGLSDYDRVGTFYIGIAADKIIGCGGVNLIDEKNVYLSHLVVKEGFRKQGIGMSLFSVMLEFAKLQYEPDTMSFITMYYHFKRFKKRGFKTIPRHQLSKNLIDFPLYTSPRYKKCAVMIMELN